MTTLAYLLIGSLALIGALCVIACSLVAALIWDTLRKAKRAERRNREMVERWAEMEDARWSRKAERQVDRLITECGGKVPS